jgi:DNA polymerase elongation subunit (family B)
MYARQHYCYANAEEKDKTLATLERNAPIRIKPLDWYSTNEKVPLEKDEKDAGENEEEDDDDNDDEENEEEESSVIMMRPEDKGSYLKKKQTTCTVYVIYLYGITEYGESVTVRLAHYAPYFYVKMPAGLTQDMFVKMLDNDVLAPNFMVVDKETGEESVMDLYKYKWYKKDLLSVSFSEKMDFWGFNNGEKSRFARLLFRNSYTMKAYERAFEKPVQVKESWRVQFPLYESNMDPLIRFFHWRNLEPCGWLEVANYSHNKVLIYSTTMFELEAGWQSVSPVQGMFAVGRVFEAAFDIECDSSDGGFPLAQKDWNKIVRPLIDEFIAQKGNVGELRVCEYILEKVQRGHLVLRNRDSAQVVRDCFDRCRNRTVVNEMFKKMTDLTMLRRGNLGGDKKTLDDKMDVLRGELVTHLNEMLPPLEGDQCIQIGTTVQVYDMDMDMEGGKRTMDFIFTLKSAVIPDRPEAVVRCFETEAEVLLEFTLLLQQLDPDLVTGYNIFGFDMKFLYQRAQELGIEGEFLKMSRIRAHECKFIVKDLSSAALGTNILEFIDIPGRVTFDLLKYMRRSHNLEAYSLDAVVSHMMRGDVTKVITASAAEEEAGAGVWLYSELSEGIAAGNFITMQKNNYIYEDKYNSGAKMEIVAVDTVQGRFLVREDIRLEPGWLYSWSEGKDDIGPHEIFAYQKIDATHRGIIAKYCLQDCRLCNRLITKLDVLSNSVAMANVNSVPLSYIFNRGQGVKLFSFVAKRARERGYCVPTRKSKTDGDQDDSYEGAFVLEPKTGIYFETEPIAVADFNSLYPSCMMSENLCYTTICLEPKYQGVEGAALLTRLGHTFEDVSWDLYDAVGGQQVVRFVQQRPGQARGVLPEILEILLKCRKDVRAEQKKTKDKQKWKVLEGQQLAYKTTANSLYGFTGAGTSKLCLKWIAAATTAIGRKNIMFAKNFVEREYPGTVVVYGDTDSIFIKFPMDGRRGLEAIYHAIDLCEEAAGRISQQLKRPHNLEFEKVICPMILAAKKKYAGLFYMSKTAKYVFKSMGILLRRRDNAPIAKYVYGDVIEILLKENDVPKAVAFAQDACRRILRGEYSLDKFIMSKSLRDGYKNPEGIAHKVLADRMGERDPGSKPRLNDRVPFVYVEQKTHIKGTKTGVQKVLQGEKIEHPDYVVAHKLPVDYLHYITNQIMNPVCQVLNLVMKDAEKVVFRDIIKEEEQRRQTSAILKSGCQDITKFFSVKKK